MAKITEIMLLQQAEQYALVIENQGTIDTFSQLIGDGFRRIGSYLDGLGELASDIPFAVYPGFEEMTKDNIKMLTGFYTAKCLPGKGGIESVTIPSRKVVVCLHKGTYDELAALYLEMSEWVKGKGYEVSGTSIEHYYTGPEVPETEHVTRVVMPLK